MPGPKPTFTERITFRSSPDMRAKLKAWAELNGMTEQNAIRQAIALLLKRRTTRARALTHQAATDSKPPSNRRTKHAPQPKIPHSDSNTG